MESLQALPTGLGSAQYFTLLDDNREGMLIQFAEVMLGRTAAFWKGETERK